MPYPPLGPEAPPGRTELEPIEDLIRKSPAWAFFPEWPKRLAGLADQVEEEHAPQQEQEKGD
jgi:hypothetical protein